MTRTAIETKSDKYVTRVERIAGPEKTNETDVLAVEEPLEIRLGFKENGKSAHRAVSITMRTPGDDFALAAGFLFTEGILEKPERIASIKHCGRFPSQRNTVRVDLTSEATVDFARLARNFYTTSSCGVCGKSSLEALAQAGARPVVRTSRQTVAAATVHRLPAAVRARQSVFEETGGLHAAALFDFAGELVAIREDVGRHNAVDKLIGDEFLGGRLPLDERMLFLSGRASFELVQKAAMARIPLIAAVGAPSSLAVEAARAFNITLLGFVRDARFNIYSAAERIK